MMTEVLQEARAMILDLTRMVININWMNSEKESYIVKSFFLFTVHFFSYFLSDYLLSDELNLWNNLLVLDEG